jgi:hypothetical protein
MKADFQAINIITKILRGIGILIIFLSIIGIIIGITWINNYRLEEFSIYLIIGSVIFGIVASVPWFAFAELIVLLIRIELNTRNIQPSMVEDPYKKIPEDSNSSYSEWIKQNPTKSINDYYSSLQNKSKK